SPKTEGSDNQFAGQCYGSLAFLLPFVEQDSIFRQLTITPDISKYDSQGRKWWQVNPDFTLSTTRIKNFKCPPTQAVSTSELAPLAANGGSDGGAVVIIHTTYGGGPTQNSCTYGWLTNSSGAPVPGGKTNYAGVAGALGKADEVSTNSASDGPGANLSLYE